MKNCSCTLASLKEQSTPAKQREVTSTGSRDQPLVVVGRTRANVSLMQTGAADDEGMAPMDVVENIDSSTRALSSGPKDRTSVQYSGAVSRFASSTFPCPHFLRS